MHHRVDDALAQSAQVLAQYQQESASLRAMVQEQLVSVRTSMASLAEENSDQFKRVRGSAAAFLPWHVR